MNEKETEISPGLFAGLGVPEFLARRREVSANAKICYAHLMKSGNSNISIHVSHEKLAELTGLSKRVIRTAIREQKTGRE